MKTASFFILGTAQLGLSYGIANRSGKPDFDSACAIVREALDSGIDNFDTAQAYGDSERVLGQCFSKIGASSASVISKLNPKCETLSDAAILSSLEESRAKLGVSRLHAVLLHRAEVLGHSKNRFESLFAECKKRGLIQYSGVSIYDEHEFEMAINSELDCIQIPFNIFDQRARELNWFRQTKEKGKQLFLRSIFLQGIIFLDSDALPNHLIFARPVLKKFFDLCRHLKRSPQDLALSFVLTYGEGHLPVIGMESVKQLQDNIAIFGRSEIRNCPEEALSFYQEIKKDAHFDRLINPSRWT